jgi:hypothetical protein
MTAATAGNVDVSVPAANTVVLGTKSASGTCYYLKDIATGTGAGTCYFQDITCAAPSATAASVTAARRTAPAGPPPVDRCRPREAGSGTLRSP